MTAFLAFKKTPLALSVALMMLLAACGGGGDGEPAVPVPSNKAPTISGTPAGGNEDQPFRFKPQASDPDGDPIQVSVSNLPSWLSYNNSTFEISGTPGEGAIGLSPEITFTVSDGNDTAELKIRIRVAFNNMKQAMRTGNHSYVADPNDFIDNAQASITEIVDESDALKATLFNLSESGAAKSDGSSLSNISWDPTHDAAHLGSTFGLNHSVLVSNASTNASYDIHQRTLGIAGEKAGDNRNARFMALASNPMRNAYRNDTSVNADMHQLLENSIEWLVGRSDFSTTPLNVVIAQMEQGYYFPDQVANRQWLDTHYPQQVSYNAAENCDAANLTDCLTQDVDLLLISQVSLDDAQNPVISQAVRDWIDAGKPVLYVHNNGNITPLGRELLTLLDVSYNADNYWWRLSIADFDSSQTDSAAPADIAMISDLLQRFKDQSFAIDLSSCNDKSCPEQSGFASQFQNAAEAVQAMLNVFDQNKVRLFDEAGYRFQKSVLLLADHYRQLARYPMDKVTTPQSEFLQSYFADHAVYQLRDINAVQADLGNFSRSDFSHITPINRQVTLTSKRHFRSAGVYAIPGQTVTVTRTDSAAVNTTVFINTLRSGATHQFNSNAYSRPKFLRSTAITIAPGESIRFTSSHGGPIQIGFDSNDQQVSFNFENIGEHAYWASSADDSSFDSALTAGEYDWAELVTSGFEVHSTLDKMRESVSDTRWNGAADMAAATERYMSNLPHVLAGFQGPGIDVVAEIHDFATTRGWTIDTIDVAKHMNADQANCGYGCSGNPYDAYWSYSPIAHGDLHELGHGLEVGRFRFNGWDGHASTNPYSYYSKSQFYKDTGLSPDCQSLPFEALKDTLQESRNQADPFAHMQAAGLTGWSQGVAIYIQMMMAAQEQGVLQNGWHLLARLHGLYREFRRADNSDEAWAAKQISLGFSQFTRQQAGALNNNDWLAIAISTVVGRDMRNFLTMWGLDIGTEASSQIASFAYPVMPMQFFDSTAKGYCQNMSPAAIDIN